MYFMIVRQGPEDPEPKTKKTSNNNHSPLMMCEGVRILTPQHLD